MAVDARTQQLQAWSLREAEAASQMAENTRRAAVAAWASYAGWYAAAETARVAQETLGFVQPARDAVGELGAAYMREVIAGTRTVARGRRIPAVRTARIALPPARKGADLVQVYSRPAEAYRREFSVTEDEDAALAAAMVRLESLISDDLLLARRDGEHQQMAEAGVTGYRRIVHPELSKSGQTCGLCLAASDRIYTIDELLPIHDECNCTTAPITDDYDPGDANDVDLEAIYKAAGGTTDGRALKKVRFEVNEHGELGPVLTVKGQRFQKKGDAPKGDPIERARKELAALEPVLESLEQRAAAGESVDGPLGYQRDRVAKLRAIAGA